MQSSTTGADWDFSSAIGLLHSLSFKPNGLSVTPEEDTYVVTPPEQASIPGQSPLHLGDFSCLWSLFGSSENVSVPATALFELEAEQASKGVRWRDELDGADLEDNVGPTVVDTAASLRTRKRAERRFRAKKNAESLAAKHPSDRGASDTGNEADSGEELENLRHSPDRRTVIQDILGRRAPRLRDTSSPPTSPSPPKAELRLAKREPPVSNPFLWDPDQFRAPPSRAQILPRDGLSSKARKMKLIKMLAANFALDAKYLSNSGLVEPAFTPLNVSNIGIHVFIDISNIMIGFHDCLKLERDMPLTSRVRRVPMSFHNLSLVLERGRPAAKRVLVGSDKFPMIEEAKSIGYETNILERVHKTKDMTPRQKKFQNAASSGMSSGSETNFMTAPSKWVEQAVDEILHLKILESLIDADNASTIVLATGDAAEAEYSGGFMRMVERALEKGWMVELVSFKLNTSSAYKRKEFRAKWGGMFKWIQLDNYVEQLMDGQEGGE